MSDKETRDGFFEGWWLAENRRYASIMPELCRKLGVEVPVGFSLAGISAVFEKLAERLKAGTL